MKIQISGMEKNLKKNLFLDVSSFLYNLEEIDKNRFDIR